MKKFCEYCLKDVACVKKERIKTIIYENKDINYLEKFYVCNECSHEFYDDLHDYNVLMVNKEIRKFHGIITIQEINGILEKYNIGKKPLSLVLGLGEITITRYLEGQNPTKENSELLLNIKNNPNLYELYLLTNKEKITEIAYKKSLGKTKQIELSTGKSKLYDSALYIVNSLEETTALSLQKILYFAQCFSKIFINKNIFDDCAEAWKYGPVYKEIYDCFSYYKGNNINYSELLANYEFNLDKDEKTYLSKIVNIFGCYSGKILREMSHLTDPWIKARVGLSDDENSNRIIEFDDINKFVEKIVKDFKINEIDDLKKYSTSLFNIALKNIEKESLEN